MKISFYESTQMLSEHDEIIDIFDENNQFLGKEKKHTVHKLGYWHRTFHCWFIQNDGQKIFVLFQKRSVSKNLHPLLLDVTAAGHLLSGESPEDGIREVTEELGIKISKDELIFLGIRCHVQKGDSSIDREFQYVYLSNSNISLNSYNLNHEEVDAIVQIEANEGLDLITERRHSMTVTGINSEKKPITMTITPSHFIKRLDNYYQQIFLMSIMYFEGNCYLTI